MLLEIRLIKYCTSDANIWRIRQVAYITLSLCQQIISAISVWILVHTATNEFEARRYYRRHSLASEASSMSYLAGQTK